MTQELSQVQPADDLYHKETHCPSCGRFVGVYERCPYCQTLTQKRLSIRVFKVLSFLVSTVGLALLLFYAQHVKTPEVTIASLGPLSNFAHVRVRGQVVKSYGVHPQWGSLAFTLGQTEGAEKKEIRISAYAKVAKDIQAKGLVPNDGDEISVEGQVRFQKDSPSLLINAPEHIEIVKRSNAKEDSLTADPGKIDKTMVGKKLATSGKIKEVVTFPRGTILRLEDGGDGLAVWVPAKILDDVAFGPQAGDVVEVIGKVKPYKESIEIEVLSELGLKKVAGGGSAGSAEPASTQPTPKAPTEAASPSMATTVTPAEGKTPAAPASGSEPVRGN